MTNNISRAAVRAVRKSVDEDGFTPNPCELVIQRP